MSTTIEHRHIPVSLLTESDTNPRKSFDEAALRDLADSIISQGLLQPITVRPHPRLTGYEVVFGHRRYRACQLAGMDDVPCIVRPMTDEQVLLAQVVENLARADVHPVEEAEAFRQLLDRHHKSADDIAAQVGKSRTYVYNRLKLSSLTRAARDECMRLGLGGEIATLIARVPPALQLKAAARCWHKSYEGDTTVLSYREARKALERAYTMPLADAVWPIHDARLVPAAGPCTSCDKCSDHDPALLADLGAGVCTDTECWDAKGAAYTTRIVEDAKARSAFVGEFTPSQHMLLVRHMGTVGGQHFNGEQAREQMLAAGLAAPVVHIAMVGAQPREVLPMGQWDMLQSWLLRDAAPAPAAAAPRAAWPRDESEDHDEGDDDATSAHNTPADRAVMAYPGWRDIRTTVMRRALHSDRTADELRHVLHAIVTDQYGDLGELTEEMMGLDMETATAVTLHAAIDTWTPAQLALALVLWSIEQGSPATSAGRLALCQRYGVDPLNPDAAQQSQPQAA